MGKPQIDIYYKDWMLALASKNTYLDQHGFEYDLWMLLKNLFNEIELDGYVKNSCEIKGGIRPSLTPSGYSFFYSGGYSGMSNKIEIEQMKEHIANIGGFVTKTIFSSFINTITDIAFNRHE